MKDGREELISNSWRNKLEAEVVKSLIFYFAKNTTLSIGVITPYQSQRRLLNNQLKDEVENCEFLEKKDKLKVKEQEEEEGFISAEEPKKTKFELLQERVMINTVDSFQGQEKDIIIVSTVRSNNRKDIGFMKDERRVNVALTRGRHLLIVVGNGNTIGSN